MAKRQSRSRAARAGPPEEGWFLAEAFKAILGDDDYSSIREADRRWDEARSILDMLKSTGEAQAEHYRAEADADGERERVRRKALASVGRAMRGGTYEARGWRLEPDEKPPTSARTVITADHWDLLNGFDLDGSSLFLERPALGNNPGSVVYAFRFVKVFSGQKAPVADGRGRPTKYAWLEALDVLLTKIVDLGKFSNATDLAKQLEVCFDDIKSEIPSDSGKWIKDNLPKLYELAKAQENLSPRATTRRKK